MEKDITNAFIDYIRFPNKNKETRKVEMEKLREHGGLKMINLKFKSMTPKIHWLIRLITDPKLKAHLGVVDALIGVQTGQLHTKDIIFAESSYIKKCKLSSLFYKEAFEGISKLDRYKHVPNILNEHLFYNPIFTTTVPDDMHDKTLKPFTGNNTLMSIKTYGDLLTAETTLTNPKHIAAIRKKKQSIHHIRENVVSNLIMGLQDRKEHKFKTLTQKFIYSDLIYEQSTDHPYQAQWATERKSLGLIDWDKVWNVVHNQFYTESLKSIIWKQLHLNFKTTHTYNRWHKTLQPCYLCGKIPDDIFHIILECKFSITIWNIVEKTLRKVIPQPSTLHERAFGLQPTNAKIRNPTIIRNWITFTLRRQILLEERRAYKKKSSYLLSESLQRFFSKFNHDAREELKTKKLLYDIQGLASKFEKLVTIGDAIATVVNGELIWKDIM